MDTGVDPRAFRFALSKIEDGNVFEAFALGFLSKVLSYDFVPMGGFRDRGIDGLEHTFHRKGQARIVYQISIERGYKGKLCETLETLKSNRVKYDQLVYITNAPVPSQDLLIDELVDKFKKNIRIWDQSWFANHVNDSDQTVRVYHVFVESYLHEFVRPGATYVAANLEEDPRVYAFLRQQWEERRGESGLCEILTDSLILYALEGTDPEKGILRSRQEILGRIRTLIKVDFKTLLEFIDRRLKVLSTKPRRINHHQEQDAYCLQYQERIAITNRNLRDQELYEQFIADTKKDAAAYLAELGVRVETSVDLVEKVLHELFSKQGLEFADFVIHSASQDAFEKNLPEKISRVVDASLGIKNAKPVIKNGLLMILRNIVYNGTLAQKQFVKRLCHTYMLMFLLQCDPQLATYFQALASRLTVYVDASILVPALSEHFLEEHNQRYSNLLRGAWRQGTKLVINEPILNELASHLEMVDRIYQQDYLGNEGFYTEESDALLIEQIMLRAFFYARMRHQVENWAQFLGAFVSPSLKMVREHLTEWLKETFGIEYVSDESLGIRPDRSEVQALSTELAKHKTHITIAGREKKALTDAQVILAIYELRRLRNELGTGSIFGYATWWLTSDITTHKAVKYVFGEKYQYDCYMRPDFLYNFISLAPSKAEADEVFLNLFPTLIGVNISYRVPEDISRVVHDFVAEHKAMKPARVRSTLRELVDNLKTDPGYWTRHRVIHFFEERKKQMLI